MTADRDNDLALRVGCPVCGVGPHVLCSIRGDEVERAERRASGLPRRAIHAGRDHLAAVLGYAEMCCALQRSPANGWPKHLQWCSASVGSHQRASGLPAWNRRSKRPARRIVVGGRRLPEHRDGHLVGARVPDQGGRMSDPFEEAVKAVDARRRHAARIQEASTP